MNDWQETVSAGREDARAEQRKLPGSLLLRIVEASGKIAEISCDSVRLFAKDGKEGNGGGSLGLRKGHVRVLVALDAGTLTASLAGETLFTRELCGGIAWMEQDVVTVLPE